MIPLSISVRAFPRLILDQRLVQTRAKLLQPRLVRVAIFLSVNPSVTRSHCEHFSVESPIAEAFFASRNHKPSELR